jgi:hypothetical protein
MVTVLVQLFVASNFIDNFLINLFPQIPLFLIGVLRSGIISICVIGFVKFALGVKERNVRNSVNRRNDKLHNS